MMEVIKWREKTMLIWKILLQVNFYERIIIKKKKQKLYTSLGYYGQVSLELLLS